MNFEEIPEADHGSILPSSEVSSSKENQSETREGSQKQQFTEEEKKNLFVGYTYNRPPVRDVSNCQVCMITL